MVRRNGRNCLVPDWTENIVIISGSVPDGPCSREQARMGQDRTGLGPVSNRKVANSRSNNRIPWNEVSGVC
jgi:hypothetical protein